MIYFSFCFETKKTLFDKIIEFREKKNRQENNTAQKHTQTNTIKCLQD